MDENEVDVNQWPKIKNLDPRIQELIELDELAPWEDGDLERLLDDEGVHPDWTGRAKLMTV